MTEDTSEGAQRMLWEKIDRIQHNKNVAAERDESLLALRHKVSVLFTVVWPVFTVFIMVCISVVAYRWAFG